jgi:hypothetical protein
MIIDVDEENDSKCEAQKEHKQNDNKDQKGVILIVKRIVCNCFSEETEVRWWRPGSGARASQNRSFITVCFIASLAVSLSKSDGRPGLNPDPRKILNSSNPVESRVSRGRFTLTPSTFTLPFTPSIIGAQVCVIARSTRNCNQHRA